MNFSEALNFMRLGGLMRRSGWNGKGMSVGIHQPKPHEHATKPYLFIEYPKGHTAYPEGCRVPWLASQTDLLAEDWEHYEPAEKPTDFQATKPYIVPWHKPGYGWGFVRVWNGQRAGMGGELSWVAPKEEATRFSLDDAIWYFNCVHFGRPRNSAGIAFDGRVVMRSLLTDEDTPQPEPQGGASVS